MKYLSHEPKGISSAAFLKRLIYECVWQFTSPGIRSLFLPFNILSGINPSGFLFMPVIVPFDIYRLF